MPRWIFNKILAYYLDTTDLLTMAYFFSFSSDVVLMVPLALCQRRCTCTALKKTYGGRRYGTVEQREYLLVSISLVSDRGKIQRKLLIQRSTLSFFEVQYNYIEFEGTWRRTCCLPRDKTPDRPQLILMVDGMRLLSYLVRQI